MMCRLAVLISNKGTGTNLQAIIDGVTPGKIKAKIVAVIADTTEAPGLQRAKKHNLPIKIVSKKEELLNALQQLNLDYICLAGWKQIILDEVIKAFPKRILNTHPGLIPDDLDSVVNNPDGTKALWNKGLLADKAIQNFLDKKATYAGCSNHFLTLEFDFGPVLGRCFEKIKKEDTVESLYTRLKKKENKLYVEVLTRLCKEEKVNILVIGQNGREHALAVTYAKSKRVQKVIMTPGNGLTDFNNKKIKNYPEIGMMDFEGIVKVCQKEKIDLVDVGQDDIIAADYVSRLESLGIKAFGPTRKAAQLEWDKAWARDFMIKYKLPIPSFKVFNSEKEAINYVNSMPDKLQFIKAAGLALGKGVIKVTNRKEAITAIKQMKNFGKAGETFLIENGLVGEEFSLFALCDGTNYKIISWAQDHKRVFDGDKGPNTGGMGCVSRPLILSSKFKVQSSKIFEKTIEGLKKENRPYKGVLYLGGIAVDNKVFVIEFNARWGDPEAEVILPSIQTDYLDIAEKVIEGKLDKLKIRVDEKVRVSIAGSAKGYPGDYSKVKGKQILGLEKAMKQEGITIYGAGVKKQENKYLVNGGRIFHLAAEGKDIVEARNKAYQAMKLISIEGDNLHYRTDIGWRDFERMRNPERSRRVERLKNDSKN